jgi:hypothetical protein
VDNWTTEVTFLSLTIGVLSPEPVSWWLSMRIIFNLYFYDLSVFVEDVFLY